MHSHQLFDPRLPFLHQALGRSLLPLLTSPLSSCPKCDFVTRNERWLGSGYIPHAVTTHQVGLRAQSNIILRLDIRDVKAAPHSKHKIITSFINPASLVLAPGDHFSLEIQPLSVSSAEWASIKIALRWAIILQLPPEQRQLRWIEKLGNDLRQARSVFSATLLSRPQQGKTNTTKKGNSGRLCLFLNNDNIFDSD